MKHIKSILVAIDSLAEKQIALDQAVELSKHSQAKLTIVDVQEGMPSFYQRLLGAHANVVDNARSERFQKITAQMAASGANVSGEILTGRPFVEIVRKAVRDNHDLVIKDSEGEGKLLAGSVDLRLLRNCPCPVWLVKADRGLRLRKILAAIDPEPGDPHHRELNDKIIRLAHSLAEQESCELHVVSAWSAPGEDLLCGRIGHERFIEFVNSSRDAAEEHLRQTLSAVHMEVHNERVHFHKDAAAPRIITTARSLDADLVVMGTVARTGISNLLMGNIAETVLRQLQRSVVAVKPDGFVTPVKL